MMWGVWAKVTYKIGSANAPQRLFYVAAFLWFVPEEVLSLCQFLLLGLSAVHRFKCVGMISAIPCLGAYSHRRRRKILHLLQLEVEAVSYYRQLCHVGLCAPWMTAYEVRNNLLTKVLLFIYMVEDTLKIVELLK